MRSIFGLAEGCLGVWSLSGDSQAVRVAAAVAAAVWRRKSRLGRWEGGMDRRAGRCMDWGTDKLLRAGAAASSACASVGAGGFRRRCSAMAEAAKQKAVELKRPRDRATSPSIPLASRPRPGEAG